MTLRNYERVRGMVATFLKALLPHTLQYSSHESQGAVENFNMWLVPLQD